MKCYFSHISGCAYILKNLQLAIINNNYISPKSQKFLPQNLLAVNYSLAIKLGHKVSRDAMKKGALHPANKKFSCGSARLSTSWSWFLACLLLKQKRFYYLKRFLNWYKWSHYVWLYFGFILQKHLLKVNNKDTRKISVDIVLTHLSITLNKYNILL